MTIYKKIITFGIPCANKLPKKDASSDHFRNDIQKMHSVSLADINKHFFPKYFTALFNEVKLAAIHTFYFHFFAVDKEVVVLPRP